MPSGSSIRISVKPYGSAACSRMTRAPAAASRACSARTSRIWIQIITGRPGGPCAWPETSSNPWPRKNTTPGSWGTELPVGGQAEQIAIEAAAAVQVAWPQQDPAAQNIHATISASR